MSNKQIMNSVDYLLSPEAIRDRAVKILERNVAGDGAFFINLDRMDELADYVIKVIKEKYPRLDIPYHSRWNHFRVGAKDRVAEFRNKLQADSDNEFPALLDLVIVSVLLDAGAGDKWNYRDNEDQVFERSEGLAVASYDMFLSGAFSSDKNKPLQANNFGLMQISKEHIEEAFQVSVSNPLVGVEGRAELLHRLGKACQNQPKLFGKDNPRPGNLFHYFQSEATDGVLPARMILETLLKSLGSIWPGRVVMNDVNLGDCWRHDALGPGIEAFVPFHKLSQWLSYSLLEPLEWSGLKIIGLDELTALAEYRNGGLFVDMQVITPKDGLAFETPVPPDSEIIIEWRALTIALLDRLALSIRDKMKMSKEDLPLAKILEGGTWWAGRKLAMERRGGKPPFQIVSDGTVF